MVPPSRRERRREHIIEAGRILPSGDDVGERQGVGPTAAGVGRRAARVQGQLRRAGHRHRAAERHVDEHVGAGAVVAVGRRGGDVCHLPRRRHGHLVGQKILALRVVGAGEMDVIGPRRGPGVGQGFVVAVAADHAAGQESRSRGVVDLDFRREGVDELAASVGGRAGRQADRASRRRDRHRVPVVARDGVGQVVEGELCAPSCCRKTPWHWSPASSRSS